MSELLVITPTLGKSPFLRESLASLTALKARGLRLRHLMIAPPETLGTLARQTGSLGSTLIGDEVRAGLYTAISLALEHAARSPDWTALTWLNDDDLLTPGFLELWRRMDGMDLGAGRVDYLLPSGKTVPIPFANRPADWLPLMASGIVPLAQPGTILSRRALETSGGFDLSYRLAADMELFSRVALDNCRLVSTQSLVARFRLVAGQLSSDRLQARMEAERLRLSLRAHLPETPWTHLRFRITNLMPVLKRCLATRSLRSENLLHK